MKNFLYYAKFFSYNALPKAFFRWNYSRLRKIEESTHQGILKKRLDYYFKIKTPFSIPKTIQEIQYFKRKQGTGYYLDLKEFLHYFKPNTKFAYHFGDETNINPFPTLIKARPINSDNKNSILFKLNKKRHFKWVEDSISFENKKNMIVWRGGAYRTLRKTFVKKFWNHPLCNIGQTNYPLEHHPWQKKFLSIKKQLKYKFIFCPEGNDVATNLKWVLSSNSLCMMPKPKFETWFMEGKLQAGVHYVEIEDNFNNLIEKIKYYLKHEEEAKKIIKNANQYVEQFKNKNLEDLLCLKVLEKYAMLSRQENSRLFSTPL